MSLAVFEVPSGADVLAVRLALGACLAPLRLERAADALRVVVAADDAQRARPWWLRAGLTPCAAEPWPDARPLRSGVLESGGRHWCLARVPLRAPPREADLVLLLTPVSRDDALRAISRSLRTWLRLPLRRGPRPLARAGAAIASRTDAVVLARAYVLASGPTPAEALTRFAVSASAIRPRPIRLRAGALSAWREIAAQTRGVWRTLSTLEEWWCPR